LQLAAVRWCCKEHGGAPDTSLHDQKFKMTIALVERRTTDEEIGEARKLLD
jgi:hypothetical protein